MWPSCGPPLSLSTEKIASVTNVTYAHENIIRFAYTWKNIFVAGEVPPFMKQSPVFSTDSGRTRWSLRLYPAGIYGPGVRSNHAALYLAFESSILSEVEAVFRFHMVDVHSKKIRSPQMNEYHVFKSGNVRASFGYQTFCPTKDLDIRDGTEIKCTVELSLSCSEILDHGAGEPFKVAYRKLGDDIAAAFTTDKHTDFIIISGGISFPVHKVILSARSSVFASMFEHDTKERRENCVNIEDLTPKALKEMLRFIYTDKVNRIETVARDLLAAAEKYALDGLKVMCEEALRGSLAVENAADILILADLYRAKNLKARAIDFIKNQTEDVLETSGFKVILASHPHLSTEILRASLNKNK